MEISRRVDQLLAAVLRGENSSSPSEQLLQISVETVRARILYHGIAALLWAEKQRITFWPPEIIDAVQKQATGQAMWELHHRSVLNQTIAALDSAGVTSFILKGTALAYDLYDEPHLRSRGDTDLLVSEKDLGRVREVLKSMGLQRDEISRTSRSDALAFQEGWSGASAAGLVQNLDLHWRVMNSPALAHVLPFQTVSCSARSLPRLHRRAHAMNRPNTLLHTCLHRSMHVTAPYFVDGTPYYGGDRLIWLFDVRLLSGALSTSEWSELVELATKYQCARVVGATLRAAREQLTAAVPEDVERRLATNAQETGTAYLQSNSALNRAWRDLQAIPGLRLKSRYLVERVFPPEGFMRAKYGDSRGDSLPNLYLRRARGLFQKRVLDQSR